ncbi:MAG: vibriolysin [Flavobacteriales bacterium]|jgi:vibriolysin
MKQFNKILSTSLALGALVSTSVVTNAADKVSLRDTGTQRLSSTRTTSLVGPLSANQLVNLNGDNDLNVRKSYLDRQGRSTVRYRQMYNNLPVFGDDVILSYANNGSYSHAHGAALYGIDKDLQSTRASLTTDDAIKTAKRLSQIKAKQRNSVTANVRYEREKGELGIWQDESGKARLVHEVSFMQYADEPSRPLYILDAQTGEELYYLNNLQTAEGSGPGGNEKIGQYHYGSDFPFLDVTQVGDTCTMESANVRSVNLNHSFDGSEAHEYECPENVFKQINGAFSPINDAHHFGSVVYDMYNDWTGGPPLDFQLRMRVHYGTSYENAFWDGIQMTFGDGESFFYPLVSLDVSAHEVSHGFTEQNSNLIYAGKSGGLNEAFSDMAGEAAENYNNGTNDWLVGAEIFKGDGALRYMSEPTLDGISIDHQDDFTPSIDVHHSSGVYNKAFYLLSTSEGWDIQKAFATYARANMLYWTANTNWDQAGNGVMDAACDLSFDVTEVKNSLAAVGITSDVSPGRDCVGSTNENALPAADFSTSKNGLTVSFGDESSDTDGTISTWLWAFGDGESSTEQHPSHDYAGAGTYSVSLTVTDNEGAADTFASSVTVSDSSSTTGGFTESDLIIASSEQRIFTVEVPAGATQLDISTSGGTGNADLAVRYGSAPTRTVNDCLQIGSGNDHSCNLSNPAAGTWYILIRGAQASTGVQLDAYWNAAEVENVAPTSEFSYLASNLSVSFSDESSDSDGSITAWSWDFGDGNTSTDQNPSNDYASAGSYQVSVTVTDDDGASSVSDQTLTVEEPGEVSTGGFTETGLNVDQNALLSFTLDVPAGASSLTITTSNGTGNVDLAVNHGSSPSRTNNDCIQIAPGNAHTCALTNPAEGTWYIVVRGAATSSDVTLAAEWVVE